MRRSFSNPNLGILLVLAALVSPASYATGTPPDSLKDRTLADLQKLKEEAQTDKAKAAEYKAALATAIQSEAQQSPLLNQIQGCFANSNEGSEEKCLGMTLRDDASRAAALVFRHKPLFWDDQSQTYTYDSYSANLKAGVKGTILEVKADPCDAHRYNVKFHANVGRKTGGKGLSRLRLTVKFEDLWVKYDDTLTSSTGVPQYLEFCSDSGCDDQGKAGPKVDGTMVVTSDGTPGFSDLDDLQAPEVSCGTNEASKKANSNQAQAKPAQRKVSSSESTSATHQGISPGALWSVNCLNFIDRNGQYGPWGQALMEEFNGGNRPEVLLDNRPVADNLAIHMGDLRFACPKYNQLSPEVKKNFWVWVIASVSAEESSCTVGARTRGPNGTAAGLTQLDLGHTQKYADAVCGDSSINVFDPDQNVTCASKMINFFSSSREEFNPNHNLFWNESYWDTLRLVKRGRPNGPGIHTNRKVQTFAACH